ncbi:MAG: M20 family metallopeptidase [Chitinophagaceae bacterium]
MHKVIQLLRDLVAIPSVNPMGKGLTGALYSERNMALYIENYLTALGIRCHWQENDPAHPNLLALIDAGKKETILLQAHMDTVSHENMTVAPFDPVIKDGLLYGRGSCDTKASLATYLYAIGEVVEKKIPLTRNVSLLFVHDEEYAFSGATEAVAHELKADFAIVGEPTELNMIHAHKGLCRFFIRTKGLSCHASMPWLGENAIYKIAPVLQAIEKYAEQLKQHTHPVLGSATVNVGRIYGGQTVNTVPAECVIEVDHRLLPGMNFQTIRETLLPFLEGTDAVVEAPYMEALGVYNDPDARVCTLLQQAILANDITPEMQAANYATDASVIHNAGIPCVVFGPGSISKAHTADEFVPTAQVEKAAEIILHLLTR